jgi:hypothetical protein
VTALDDIIGVCLAHGFVAPKATRRMRTTYRWGSKTYRSFPSLIKACKRLQCVVCAHFVRECDREVKREDLDALMRGVSCGDERGHDEAFASYRLANFECWLAGCSAGLRPDVLRFEDEPPPKMKGGWWSLIPFPCEGFKREELNGRDIKLEGMW